jgi:hypothetical protein
MKQLETPVCLIVFNRPEPTRRVFEKIAGARPARLLLIADGPRAGRQGESELCEEVRKIVSAVNWPCRVETNFSDKNLGCRRRVISGLDWVFQLVEEAIILEDDCIPDASFFPYCSQLLDRYRYAEQVGIISGYNPLGNTFPFSYSYCFTKMILIWGWATWRRSWKKYDEQMASWPSMRDEILNRLWSDPRNQHYWATILDSMHSGDGPDTWDYQLVFKSWAEQWLNIIPSRNLIENIGIGPDATHTKKSDPIATPPAESLPFPLVHPDTMVEWKDHPRLLQSRIYSPDIVTRAQRAARLKLRELASHVRRQAASQT